MNLKLAMNTVAITASALMSVGCGSVPTNEGGTSDTGAAHPGVRVTLEPIPEINIHDEFGTDARVWVTLEHLGGPDATTFEVVSASLGKDLEHFADIELTVPEGNEAFSGLAVGEVQTVALTGSIDASGPDWALCAAGPDEEMDELRVTLDLTVRMSPGANDESDDSVFESHTVGLNCVFAG